MTLTYLLPLRRDRAAELPDGELARYVRTLADQVDELLIVDGSPPNVFARHHALFAGHASHVAPDPSDRCANGKAWAVITGVRRARHDVVVIADDDVRWDEHSLSSAANALRDCELVLPANYFTPMTWHSAWDTGRILLNRATAHDWPGTLALRRTALTGASPYDGDVLFENCELVRTMAASGGRVTVRHELLVARRPSTLRHFLEQRPRQAYDDMAQPARLTMMLAILPTAVLGGRRGTAVGALIAVALAEAGRRRGGGTRVFPWYTSLCAPVWLLERGVLSWWAAWLRVSGRGVGYAGHRFLRAATPPATLQARLGRG